MDCQWTRRRDEKPECQVCGYVYNKPYAGDLSGLHRNCGKASQLPARTLEEQNALKLICNNCEYYSGRGPDRCHNVRCLSGRYLKQLWPNPRFNCSRWKGCAYNPRNSGLLVPGEKKPVLANMLGKVGLLGSELVRDEAGGRRRCCPVYRYSETCHITNDSTGNNPPWIVYSGSWTGLSTSSSNALILNETDPVLPGLYGYRVSVRVSGTNGDEFRLAFAVVDEDNFWYVQGALYSGVGAWPRLKLYRRVAGVDTLKDQVYVVDSTAIVIAASWGSYGVRCNVGYSGATTLVYRGPTTTEAPGSGNLVGVGTGTTANTITFSLFDSDRATLATSASNYGGVACAPCYACCDSQLSLTIDGIVERVQNYCSGNCPDLDGEYIVDYTNTSLTDPVSSFGMLPAVCLWTYEYPSPITCAGAPANFIGIEARLGYSIAGSIGLLVNHVLATQLSNGPSWRTNNQSFACNSIDALSLTLLATGSYCDGTPTCVASQL